MTTTPAPADEAAGPLLHIENLHVAFGGNPAVRGADLTVAPGERVAVVGQSGSGKSTLAHAVMGLLPGSARITDGTIRLAGEDITHAPEKRLRDLRGRVVGLVPQDPMTNLNPVAKVGRQVAETLRTHGLADRRTAAARAVELLAQAGLPEPERRARQYPHELSGGQRQRVLIAIGLACRPHLLIADEPTSALDVTVQQQILDHLQTLTDELGTALLLITHDLGLAAERADRVLVMSQGEVAESGPARRVLTDPAHEYTRRLVAAAPSLRAEFRPRTPAPAAEPLLQVEGVTKEYRLKRGAAPFKAVDGVSFTVARGRTTAVVGESGSGKTTTARMVLGLLPPTGGAITLDGTPVAGPGAVRGSGRRAVRRAMQPVFQDPYASLDPMFTVEQLIAEPLTVFGVGDAAARRSRVTDLLDQVALPADTAHRHPNELSGGQRQRVAIARALALSPSLVVCDEPVSALDVLVQQQVLTLLRTLQDDLGVSYLFISHDLAVVREVAHEVVVMKEGRVVEQGAVEKVLGAPEHPYTRKLSGAVPGATVGVS
ncbi:peptide ABC transporter ATP-binding protein [Streptomyces ruber]|uniref:Peptide ABC transporter ATP-binding protein n=2 Tax=Streptomyces TaxID=1883 RepID=A0A918ETJ0_9ACTN|nr:ABC transporter ATP-binding protein [Streptomyces ruber]GGQ69392.1 peptide ABC transporter ATP-binding protein [Streptomyces ruber]